MYYAYILKCSDDTLYTGTTNDLKKRVKAHNESNIGAKYTKTRRPVKLVYSEKRRTRGRALSREHEIKSLSRGEKLMLIKHAEE